MNKRIIELADQAGFVRFSPDEDPTMPIDWSCDYSVELERFAKLVIEECAHFQYIRAIYRDGYDKHEDAEAMRSFFGV